MPEVPITLGEFAQALGIAQLLVDNLELSAIRRLPNALSIARIVAAFGVLLFYEVGDTERMAIAIAMIVFAEASDHLDGFLARKLQVVSETGYILDGLADRALYSALILTISRTHAVNVLAVWLLIFGQIAVYAIRLMQAEWKGKNWRVRRLHLLHWAGIRLWVATFLAQDICMTWKVDMSFDYQTYSKIQNLVAVLTIAILYYAIALNVHESLRPDKKIE